MQDEIVNIGEVQELRNLIDSYIDEKIKKTEENKKKKKAGKEDPATEKIVEEEIDSTKAKCVWLASAASRAAQRQIVTHAIKYLNPDAKGSEFLVEIHEQANNSFVSTSTLSPVKQKKDSTGNAAALDVFVFLTEIIFQNENLLSRILRSDKILIEALPGSDEEKKTWLKQFAKICLPNKPEPCSHTLAKQIYFPVGDGYRILAPLFPTTLAHEVFENISDSKFGEENVNARNAKKARKPHTTANREFLNLAEQKFGGTNKQNISYLNSKRNGKIYLLPSLPPQWQSSKIKLPFHIHTIFHKNHFSWRVRDLTNQLKNFLNKTDYNNSIIRQTRADLVSYIIDELMCFAMELQGQNPGWSAKQECSKLSSSQAFWLDPGRSISDPEWGKQRQMSDWKSDVSHDFASWLNQSLQTDENRFGDDEFTEWKKLLERQLHLLKEEIL